MSIIRYVGYCLITILYTSCAPPQSITIQNEPDRAATEGYIPIESGVRLYYRIYRTGADTLVVIHGSPAHLNSLAPDLLPLAAELTVIFYDQRGGGRSDLITDPALLTWQHHVSDLEVVRKFFGLSKLKLFGISWGAGLAALYTDRYPGNVDRLLLAPMRAYKNRPSSGKPQTESDSLASARMAELVAMWDDADEILPICQEYWDLVIERFVGNPEMALRVKSDWCDEPEESIRSYRRNWSATWESLGEFDWRPMLATIEAPALVVVGHDAVAQNDWLIHMPNSRALPMTWPGGLKWVAEPELFFPGATTFIKGQWPEAAEIITE